MTIYKNKIKILVLLFIIYIYKCYNNKNMCINDVVIKICKNYLDLGSVQAEKRCKINVITYKRMKLRIIIYIYGE